MEVPSKERNNRLSRFPGTKDSEVRKRGLDHLDSPSQKESPSKIPTIFKPLSKEATNPWKRYIKSFKINQAGSGYVVHATNPTFQEGIIKSTKTPRSELSKIIAKHHQRNIVHIQEAFYHEGQMFFLYELLDVSLGQIFGSPLGRLKLFEVAAFSKEILTGLEYIHQTLKISHGNIESGNILLSVNGQIKIGTSMLDNKDDSYSQDDVRAIGQIIVECLEPRAFLQGGSLSETWPQDISEFVEFTKIQSAQRLLKHDFLNKSPGSSCLKPYIRFAREAGAKEIEFGENI
ncbi:kinase-like protein [Penicillium verhagenii]|uniref:kinase-like protein n=1 Tax=Penicillium verhagenii TaxID=1562060 RepID=UPI002545077F|nr:kinase-like protein [Penicillium verhagenii]KAJ5928352.1 kinase-like protein [Penicillium verhagenii]